MFLDFRILRTEFLEIQNMTLLLYVYSVYAHRMPLRPYYQDGYLAGTEDISTDYGDDKLQLDFKRRLIAKFEIQIDTDSVDFWGEGFSRIPKSALYPKNDRIEELCKGLKSAPINR